MTIPDTDQLLKMAERGEDDAREKLLTRHRGRLRQMIAVRLDRRVAARIDPSDVVQEALAEAADKLPGYLRDRPLAFYPWLRLPGMGATCEAAPVSLACPATEHSS